MLKQPTASELEILNILWEKKSATVREVHEVINSTKPVAYTTVLKLMQIMTEKNLVVRNEEGKAHLYQAEITKDQTQKGLVSDLVNRAFQGSAMLLMQHILQNKTTSPAEIEEIRRMIENAEAQDE